MPEDASWREGVAEQVPEVLALMLLLTHCVPLDSLLTSLGLNPPLPNVDDACPFPPSPVRVNGGKCEETQNPKRHTSVNCYFL